MSDDKRYNGWTNYETWAVKLWIDNDEGTYDYWRETTREVWADSDDKHPNQFMDRSGNARSTLAERLKDEHDSQSDHPVFKAADGSVYADLLNAALSEVDWYEIADSMLSDLAEDSDDDEPKYESARS
jgi:hypothetical protein